MLALCRESLSLADSVECAVSMAVSKVDEINRRAVTQRVEIESTGYQRANRKKVRLLLLDD